MCINNNTLGIITLTDASRKQEEDLTYIPLHPLRHDAVQHTVLCSFSFTNRKLVPEGIHWSDRGSNDVVDAHHAEWAALFDSNPELLEEGRFDRSGRISTGIPVIKNLPFVSMPELRVALANNRYYITNGLHAYKREPAKGKTTWKYVVVVPFMYLPELSADDIPRMPKVMADAVRSLVTTTWGYCHGWANPNHKASLNFTVREAGKKPRHTITAINREIRAVATRS